MKHRVRMGIHLLAVRSVRCARPSGRARIETRARLTKGHTLSGCTRLEGRVRIETSSTKPPNRRRDVAPGLRAGCGLKPRRRRAAQLDAQRCTRLEGRVRIETAHRSRIAHRPSALHPASDRARRPFVMACSQRGVFAGVCMVIVHRSTIKI